MNLNGILSFATPLNINNHDKFDYFERTIIKLYSLIEKPYPEHLIKNDSPSLFTNKIIKFLDKRH